MGRTVDFSALPCRKSSESSRADSGLQRPVIRLMVRKTTRNVPDTMKLPALVDPCKLAQLESTTYNQQKNNIGAKTSKTGIVSNLA